MNVNFTYNVGTEAVLYFIQEPNKAFHLLKFNITLVSKYINVYFFIQETTKIFCEK
jgi:hypothetical protein